MKNRRGIEIKTMQDKIEHDLRVGDVIVVDFGENELSGKSGQRPVVVVSNGKHNDLGDAVVVVPLTRACNKPSEKYDYYLLPYQILLDNELEELSFLKYKSIIQCETVMTVPKKRVMGISGNLGKKYQKKVAEKLYYLFSMSRLDFGVDNSCQ